MSSTHLDAKEVFAGEYDLYGVACEIAIEVVRMLIRTDRSHQVSW